jgi:hypothetical protein
MVGVSRRNGGNRHMSRREEAKKNGSGKFCMKKPKVE